MKKSFKFKSTMLLGSALLFAGLALSGCAHVNEEQDTKPSKPEVTLPNYTYQKSGSSDVYEIATAKNGSVFVAEPNRKEADTKKSYITEYDKDLKNIKQRIEFKEGHAGLALGIDEKNSIIYSERGHSNEINVGQYKAGAAQELESIKLSRHDADQKDDEGTALTRTTMRGHILIKNGKLFTVAAHQSEKNKNADDKSVSSLIIYKTAPDGKPKPYKEILQDKAVLFGIAVDNKASVVYLSSAAGKIFKYKVDSKANKLTNMGEVDSTGFLIDLQYDSNKKRLYAMDQGDLKGGHQVHVLDVSGDKIKEIATLATSSIVPNSLLINQKGTRLYVANRGGFSVKKTPTLKGTLDVFDVSGDNDSLNNITPKTFKVEPGANSLALSKDGENLYITVKGDKNFPEEGTYKVSTVDLDK